MILKLKKIWKKVNLYKYSFALVNYDLIEFNFIQNDQNNLIIKIYYSDSFVNRIDSKKLNLLAYTRPASTKEESGNKKIILITERENE